MPEQSRIQGIDTLKLFASFAVICLHTAPFEYSAAAYPGGMFATLEITIYLLCRFAVPYFFITAGFFFAKSLQKGTLAVSLYKKYAGRLLLIFLAWSFFYALLGKPFLSQVASQGVAEALRGSFTQSILAPLSLHPINLLLEGSAAHLWFIPALLISLTILYVCISLKKEALALPLGLALYVFGTLAGAYANTPLGIHVAFNPRNGPFFGAFFTIFGWWFARAKKYRVSFKAALLIAGTGLALQFLEAFLLHYYAGVNAYYDYAFGAIPLGIGIFLIGLTRPCLGEGTFLVFLSQLSLGIYLVHPFFYYTLLHAKRFFPPLAWDLSISFIVFALSALAVAFLKKNGFTKKLVT